MHFHIFQPLHDNSPRFFLTDTEGASNIFSTSMDMIRARSPKAIGIFGGDTCDKGPDAVKNLYNILYDGRFVAYLAGNRDINKVRLLEVFSKDFVEGFADDELGFNLPPFWAINPANSPKAFLDQQNILLENYKSLTYEDKQVLVAKWILAKTMGAPYGFRFMQEALSNILSLPPEDIDDKLVLRFFIEGIISPEHKKILLERNMLMGEACKPADYDMKTALYQSIMYHYLHTAKLIYVDGVNLYAHSIFAAENFPYLLSGKKVDKADFSSERAHFEAWVAALQDEYTTNLSSYYNYVFMNIESLCSSELVSQSGIMQHPIVMAALPNSVDNPYAITSSNYISRAIQSRVSLNECLTDLALVLKSAGFVSFYTGHNPQAQDMPVCRQVAAVNFVMCDTARPPKTPLPAFTINFDNGCHVLVSERFEGDSRRYLHLGKEVQMDGETLLISSVTRANIDNSVSYVLIKQAFIEPGYLVDLLNAEPILISVDLINRYFDNGSADVMDERLVALKRITP